jgi:bacterial/archaeal transporter family-2 protein
MNKMPAGTNPLKPSTIMDKVLWIVLAFVAGALLPLQGAFNARLGGALNSPIHASVVSFVIGTLAVIVYVVVTRQTVSWSGLGSAPWYVWFGGLCGAFSLTAIIVTFPKLGPGLAFGLLVAGQLIVSVVLEHFNILVAQPHPMSLLRLLGVGLVLGGVVCIRAF